MIVTYTDLRECTKIDKEKNKAETKHVSDWPQWANSLVRL